MSTAIYDSFIADYYDESPLVQKRLQDVAFYREAAREFGDPILELGCGTGRVTMAHARTFLAEITAFVVQEHRVV